MSEEMMLLTALTVAQHPPATPDIIIHNANILRILGYTSLEMGKGYGKFMTIEMCLIYAMLYAPRDLVLEL